MLLRVRLIFIVRYTLFEATLESGKSSMNSYDYTVPLVLLVSLRPVTTTLEMSHPYPLLVLRPRHIN